MLNLGLNTPLSGGSSPQQPEGNGRSTFQPADPSRPAELHRHVLYKYSEPEHISDHCG
jgi:hypothetical protein